MKPSSASAPINFKIETGIPLPGGSRNLKYPWHQMSVGDSFSFNADLVRKVWPAASYFARRNPEFRFSIRKQRDGNYRVWRIPPKGDAA